LNIKSVINFKMNFQEFRLYQMKKGGRYVGIRKSSFTYEGIGKHYYTIGLCWYEIQCYNSLKA